MNFSLDGTTHCKGPVVAWSVQCKVITRGWSNPKLSLHLPRRE